MASAQIERLQPPDGVTPPAVKFEKSPFSSTNPNIGIAFSPNIYIYFPAHKRICISGPWYKNWPHATFAFTREYTKTHRYDLTSRYGEELIFTNYYREPYIRLDVNKTIMALCHNNNTIPNYIFGKTYNTNYTLSQIIKDKQSLYFYVNLMYCSGGPISC